MTFLHTEWEGMKPPGSWVELWRLLALELNCEASWLLSWIVNPCEYLEACESGKTDKRVNRLTTRRPENTSYWSALSWWWKLVWPVGEKRTKEGFREKHPKLSVCASSSLLARISVHFHCLANHQKYVIFAICKLPISFHYPSYHHSTSFATVAIESMYCDASKILLVKVCSTWCCSIYNYVSGKAPGGGRALPE